MESREIEKDVRYYQNCLEGIMEYSHNTKVFCLIHKMDLIPDDQRDIVIVIYIVNYYNLKSLSFCS